MIFKMAAHTEVAFSAVTWEAVHQQGNQKLHENLILAVPSLYHVSGLQTSCFRVCKPQGQGYAVASSSVGAKTDESLVKCIMQVSTYT